jgi:hypothetical protein
LGKFQRQPGLADPPSPVITPTPVAVPAVICRHQPPPPSATREYIMSVAAELDFYATLAQILPILLLTT